MAIPDVPTPSVQELLQQNRELRAEIEKIRAENLKLRGREHAVKMLEGQRDLSLERDR